MQRLTASMQRGMGVERQTPLSDALLKHYVPAVVSDVPHESRSAEFRPFCTLDVITALRSEGFQPYSARQVKSHDASNRQYARHMVRMRHASIKSSAGEVFEVILLNALDGTQAWRLFPGFFRFVCANGLFVGDTFAPQKIVHRGADKTIEGIIEAALRVVKMAPDVLAQVDAFKAVQLNAAARAAYAKAAHQIRFPDAYGVTESGVHYFDKNKAPITPGMLLDAQREEDSGSDLWTVYNRVQENAVRGGQKGTILSKKGKIRNATVQPVVGITQGALLNQKLWNLTENTALALAA